MSVLGLFTAAVLILSGKRPKKFLGTLHFTVNKRFGGMSLGIVTITDKYSGEGTLLHEAGHSLQNALLGPFMPILVGIPSAVRYWYFIWREKKGKFVPPYDSVWFERDADRLGLYLSGMWGEPCDK